MNYFEALGSKFVEKDLIQQEDKDIYVFGLQQGFFMALNLITALVIGGCMGKIGEVILYVAMFIPLRMFAGGYHTNTHLSCYFISSMLTFLALKLADILAGNPYWIGILAISALVIWIFCPIEDRNKPLEKAEEKKYRKTARTILLLELFVAVAMKILEWESFFLIALSSFVVLSILMIIGFLKNKCIQ